MRFGNRFGRTTTGSASQWRAVAGGVLAAGMLAAGCTQDVARAPGYNSPGFRTPGAPDGTVVSARLIGFDRCDDLLAWFKKEGAAHVGPYGFDGGSGYYYADGAVESQGRSVDKAETLGGDAVREPEGAATPGEAPGVASGALDTGTNNQEADVDEADRVKTDGRRIVTLVNGTELVVVDATSGVPIETGRLDLPVAYADQMFLVGDRVYVTGSRPQTDHPVADDNSTAGRGSVDSPTADIAPYPSAQGSTLVEIALSGDTPEVTGQVTVDGTITAGRMTDGTVRFVVSNPMPSLGFVAPQRPDEQSAKIALNTNRQVLAESTIDDWLPSRIDIDGKRIPLVACNAMMRPSVDAGLGTSTILTIPDGLSSMTASGVVADGAVTYASTGGLYLATAQWRANAAPAPSGPADESITSKPVVGSSHTQIHRFDISARDTSTYQGSGDVPGTLIGQYAMSEWEDHLRVASTIAGGADDNGSDQPQRSMVTVLGVVGDRLAPTGSVDGLGPTEQIQGVRFDGATAYVVTFRQTDPLYVLDLSDPTAPRVLGELKVPGFSSYLHPIGDHLVIGVGSDADLGGRVKGAKVSLFDTSDPTAPEELSTWTLPDGDLSASHDPHAFMWNAERRLAVVGGSWYDQASSGSGAIVLRIDAGKITEAGRITHDAASTTPGYPECPPGAACAAPGSYVGQAPIDRSLFVGDALFALSMAGISSHDQTTLDRTGWLAF